MTNEELIQHAFKAMDNAYAPYSQFHVGSCVLCKDGTYFYGANIENASYPATNCGERSAVFAAYSAGYHKSKIEKIAIVSDGHRIAWPCGVCRQVLTELLSKDTEIVLATKQDTMVVKVKDLLPYAFGPEDLNVEEEA